VRALSLVVGLLVSSFVYATEWAPHNMTSDNAPTPYVASASSFSAGRNPSLAFDGLFASGNSWLGTGSGTDSLTLDLGAQADYAPHNMTSNNAPFPYIASASSTSGSQAPYAAFDGNTANPWIGTGGGTDYIELDLGGAAVSPHNMSSNSAPSPFVAAASSNYPSYDPYHAFDGAVGGGQYWIGTGSGTDWLSLDLGSGNATILVTYSIQANTIPEPTRSPKNWTMQGSNDNSTWTTVDTRTNETSWSSGEVRTYTCATQTTAYRYFRVNITANNGDATYTDIGELSLFGSVTRSQALDHYSIRFSTNGAEPVNRGPKNWTMQGSNDGTSWTTLDTQTNQTSWTTGLTRTYTPASATVYRYYKLSITANNGDATFTSIGEMYLYSSATNPNAKIMLSYAVEVATGGEPTNRAPKTWTMQGSTDQVTWHTLDTQSSQTGWSAGELRTFNCATPTSVAYEYYKLSITANNGDATNTDVAEMYMYDTAVASTARHLLLIN